MNELALFAGTGGGILGDLASIGFNAECTGHVNRECTGHVNRECTGQVPPCAATAWNLLYNRIIEKQTSVH